MIYFLQAGLALAPVKIGFTDGDVDKRLAQLQNGNAEPLYLIAKIPGDRGTEARLHRRFAGGRIHGEWFDPHTPGLQDFLSDAITFEGLYPWDRTSPAIQEVLAA